MPGMAQHIISGGKKKRYLELVLQYEAHELESCSACNRCAEQIVTNVLLGCTDPTIRRRRYENSR